MVCPWCDFHFPLEAEPRLGLLVDQGSFQALDPSWPGPTRFGRATLLGRPLALALGDPTTPWTDNETRALISLAEQAHLDRIPFLWVVSGPPNAENALSWPSVEAALSQLAEDGLWITLLAGPCYGPVAALTLQADLVLAEPGAVLSPLLPAVLREAGRLPAESSRPPRQLLQEGWADAILPRRDQRDLLALLLDMFGVEGKLPQRTNLSSQERVSDPLRPLALLDTLFDPFIELHGDRQDTDDLALVGGVARLGQNGPRLLVLATARGESWREVRRRHGGAIGMGGWRKAGRLLRLAGRFGLPVVTLVGRPKLRAGRRDRPPALAGTVGKTLHTLLNLPVPTVAVRLNGGGGMAALALSAADRILAPETLSGELQREGLPLDATFADTVDLSSSLVQILEDLTQTYAVHGPLGRRKLVQHRRIRWTRVPFPTGSDEPQENATD
jgi:acetyl-CoA carboxylase carboxyl transferase subunit beta